jgi:very-short-patch-repair endonuclease
MYDFGVRTRAQLRDEGLTDSIIDKRCRRGIYHRLLPSVYSVCEPTSLSRCAAILAWEPTAVFSHRTAAWLWQMLPEPTVFEATVRPNLHKAGASWVVLHRRHLEPAEVVESWDMPTVDPEQALIDCLAVLPAEDADRLVDAELARTVNFEALRLLHKKYPRRLGNGDVERQIRTAALLAASEPERLLAREFARRNFTIAANAPVGPYSADFFDARARLVVEVDGLAFHNDPAVFRRDRRRQNWLLLRGMLILRYAAADVFDGVSDVADEVMLVARRRRKSLG